MLTIGSLFSGIGGLELGLERAGLGPVLWQVEKDDWCREQLARHYPDAARYNDVRDATASTLRDVDIVCGGFPCQDVSSTGLGRGLAGERSGLWFEFARIVGELRPRYVIVENVTSGAKKWLDAVVRGLGERGYDCLPLPVSAASIGAPHRRERLFVVGRRVASGVSDAARSGCSSGGERDAELVLHAGGGGALPDLGHADGAGRRPQAGDGESYCSRLGGPETVAQRAAGGADRCARPVVYPPRPGDVAGWGRHFATGGPAPGIKPPVRGGADGVSGGVAGPDAAERRRWRAERKQHRLALKALGNAVVPECAEVAGWVIRALEAERG